MAHKYRELHIPVDDIVQDWFWWTTKGEFVFNKNYPDPKGMIDDLHRNNFHLMISVWPYFDPGTPTYADMDKRGFFIDRTKTRAYHPKGMAVYDRDQPRGPRLLLESDGQGAVPDRRGCLVAGYDGTGDRGPRRKLDAESISWRSGAARVMQISFR